MVESRIKHFSLLFEDAGTNNQLIIESIKSLEVNKCNQGAILQQELIKSAKDYSSKHVQLHNLISIIKHLQIEMISSSGSRSPVSQIGQSRASTILKLLSPNGNLLISIQLQESVPIWIGNLDPSSPNYLDIPTILLFRIINDKILIQEAKEYKSVCVILDRSTIRHGQTYLVKGCTISTKIKKEKLKLKSSNSGMVVEIKNEPFWYVEKPEKSIIKISKKRIENCDGEVVKSGKHWEFIGRGSKVSRFLHNRETFEKTASCPLLVKHGQEFLIGDCVVRAEIE